MTMFIKAPCALTNPLPDTPVLIDFDELVLLDFDASTLSLANGASIDSWEARTFASKAAGYRKFEETNQEWSKPKFSAGTFPAVAFDGTSHIRTQTHPYVDTPNGFTVAIVCSDISTPSEISGLSGSRLFAPSAGGGGAGWGGIRPQKGQFYSMPTPGKSLGQIPAGMIVICAAFNGDSSEVLINDGMHRDVDLRDHSAFYGFTLGYRNGSKVENDLGMAGKIHRFIVYDETLTSESLRSLSGKLQREYAIA